MTPMPNINPSSSTGSPSAPHSGPSAGASLYNGLAAKDERLGWLDLRTVPSVVNRSLRELFTRALEEDRDAKRAAQFLLSLWSPSKYPLDIHDLGFFDRELNYACRHVLNFIIGVQVNFRQIVSDQLMEPVLVAWGEQGDDH
ncbi:hypothetical protein ACJO2E_08700 [Marinobacter sp. M1N3S26]|uniref:DUF7673 family protein n=1 Tax=Marinobacter sp. M1N3S26 TaxID=3382299 RepID=UPI00387B5C64